MPCGAILAHESAVRPSALGEKTGPAPKPSESGYTVPKKARALSNTYSSDRVAACQRCLEGECGVMGDRLFCDSCGRGLHMESAQAVADEAVADEVEAVAEG